MKRLAAAILLALLLASSARAQTLPAPDCWEDGQWVPCPEEYLDFDVYVSVVLR